jgi:hypothetical protein
MNDMKFTTAEDYMKDSEEIPYNNDTEETEITSGTKQDLDKNTFKGFNV